MKPRKIVEIMKKYEPNEYENFIKLDANERYDENLISFNQSVSDYNRYPDNDSKDFKKALSEYLYVDANNIVVGNGSSEMIELLLKSYIDPGDVVLSFSPSFVMYKIFTEIYNGKFIDVKSKDDYVSDMDDMIKAYKKYKPKMIFLCNPNNPTGYMIPKSEIEYLLKSVDCLVVVDEAYVEFTEGSVINRIDNYDNLVVLRTFSKAWGLAGARLGYMVSNERIITTADTVKSPYNLNKMTQSLGLMALDNKDILLDSVRSIIVEREKMYKKLIELEIKVYKSSANFLYFKADMGLFENLLDRRVVIRSFNNGYYRVTIGSEDENKLFLESIKDFQASLIIETRGVV